MNERRIMVVVLCALASLAILLEKVSSPIADGKLPRSRILYVADPAFYTSNDDRGGIAQLKRQVERLLPHERLEWDVLAIDPRDGAGLQASIRERRAEIAVLESDAYLDGLGVRPVDAALIVSSSRTPADLSRRFEHARQANAIAFVSWFAHDARRMLQAVERIAMRPLGELTVFADTETIAAGEIEPAQSVAAARGLAMQVLRYDNYDEFLAAWSRHGGDRERQVVYLPLSTSLLIHIEDVPKLVARRKLLAAYSRGDQVEHGGLIAVDAPTMEVHVQLARYIVLIAQGASAATLPIAVPTRTQMALNLSAANALGLTIPYELLVEADELFE